MDIDLIQTLWVWWGTIPSDFKFLLLLPFAIGGTALLTDLLQQVLADRGWRLPWSRLGERAARRSSGAAAVRLGGHAPVVRARRRHARTPGDGTATTARASRAR